MSQPEFALRRLKRLCVYAPATDGTRAEFRAATRAFARELAERRIELIYGGAKVGHMRILADVVLAGGGRVTGVIPGKGDGSLAELAHPGLTKLVPADSMHDRKAKMARDADAFVALPGGIGTLEEILEVVTWTQLGIHAKPCGLLNLHGYFDPLLAQLDAAVEESFLTSEHRDIVVTEEQPQPLLTALESWQPPAPKWNRSPQHGNQNLC